MTPTELRAARKAVVGMIGASLLVAETVLVILLFQWVLGKTW
jgi:hypothetical protein